MPRPRQHGDKMTTTHQQSEAIQRGARMLRTAFGPAIAGFLEDPSIVEVMLNPDGRLWIDRLSSGLEDTGRKLPAADGERIVARLEDTGEVTCKVYKEEDGRRWLLPLNPRHEPIRTAFTVLGTVIGKWEDED